MNKTCCPLMPTASGNTKLHRSTGKEKKHRTRKHTYYTVVVIYSKAAKYHPRQRTPKSSGHRTHKKGTKHAVPTIDYPRTAQCVNFGACSSQVATFRLCMPIHIQSGALAVTCYAYNVVKSASGKFGVYCRPDETAQSSPQTITRSFYARRNQLWSLKRATR